MRFLIALLVFVSLTSSAVAVETRREEIKTRIETRKEERMASRAALRDQRKAKIIDRIEEKLNQINKRRTDHFLKVLDRLREILSKIDTRTDRAQSNGKNVSSVRIAISAAETAIDAAEVAVNAQADKEYEITLNDETKARNDVGLAMKKLQEDLRATRDFVHKARTAVFDALRALTAIVGEDPETATPSATPT